MALELAERGKETALVCSGDSGVYGLAALVYELRGERSAPEIAVVPGLTAAWQRRGGAGCAADPRFCRDQPQRPADSLAGH